MPTNAKLASSRRDIDVDPRTGGLIHRPIGVSEGNWNVDLGPKRISAGVSARSRAITSDETGAASPAGDPGFGLRGGCCWFAVSGLTIFDSECSKTFSVGMPSAAPLSPSSSSDTGRSGRGSGDAARSDSYLMLSRGSDPLRIIDSLL